MGAIRASAQGNRPESGRRFWLALAACLLGLVQPVQVSAQPEPGGGRPPLEASSALPAYAHRDFSVQKLGKGAQAYWLIEPAEPTPAKAPVIVFLHGWLSINPGIYGAWIEHLARRGAIVIYPRYQIDISTPPAEFLPNARAAILDALDVLSTGNGRVRPDLDRFAMIGHSAGGNLAAQLAAVQLAPFPKAKAVVCVMPGEVLPQSEPRLDRIPADTLLLVIAGDRDLVVGDHRARQIYLEATAIPANRKEYVLYRSDHSGPLPLLADHTAPQAALPQLDTGDGPLRQVQMGQATVDLLDRFGFWRVTDLTLRTAFTGLSLDEATENGNLIRNLGRWGHGNPVRVPLCGDDLNAIPRVIPSNGARLIAWPALPGT